MNKYINCIVDHSSEGSLLIGDTHTAFIDCGMMFCAGETIQKAKDALGGRPLDYMLMTHTHYDHIGALPFFRKEWPAMRSVTTAVGAQVLAKDTPRRVIRELSLVAAQAKGIALDTSYSDDMFCGDIIVKDGESISLGDISVEVLETPGHTRDSISFFVPQLELLILNETTGVLMPDNSVHPGYLVSCADAIASIEKCRKKPFKYLSIPHRGVLNDEDTKIFFDKAMETTTTCRDFILQMKENGLNDEQMQDEFFRKYFTEILAIYQPKEAFMANAKATIANTLKEIEKK